MFSFNIKYQSQDDLHQAQEKVSKENPQQILIQIFCGNPTKECVSSLIKEVTAVFPNSPIIGTTTAGEIMEGESLDQTIVISFTQFEKTQIRSALVTQNQDLYQAGLKLASDISQPDIRAAIIFGCGIKNGGAINGEPLLNGFQDTCPEVVIAGAQAGDNGAAQKTYVFTQDGYTDAGAAAVSLGGKDLIAHNNYNLSWVPLGKAMEISHAENTCIHTIDGKPAKDIYTHYLGENVGERLPQSAAEFPLVVERHGVQLARHANRLLPDGSLDFMAPFYTGEKVWFAFCHSGLVAQAARQMFDNFTAKSCDAIFIYSCLTRKWVLGEDSKLELAPLACLAPTSGFFSYGEYYSNRGKNLFLSQTMTVLALHEKGIEGHSKEGAYDTEPDFPDNETKQVQDLKALHRLVETSAAEREEVILELQEALSEIKTLRGFIPICAHCKKIRDDQGYWNRIENYIQDHTDAQFSHGICPDCVKEIYPSFKNKRKKDKSS